MPPNNLRSIKGVATRTALLMFGCAVWIEAGDRVMIVLILTRYKQADNKSSCMIKVEYKHDLLMTC